MTTATTNPIITTRNAADVMAAVRDALDSRTPLIDYGHAHATLGHAPPSHHTQLSQQPDPANQGILEHYTRDLTVRAAAGITLGDLQRALKPTNQFAPIDGDDDITLGEAIHHNIYGPLRVGYGSIRDLLLGLHYIDGQARDVHVGGRTVKNVAGYDLSRFMVGSLGELGIVHEATLRTYAIPEHVLIVELTMSDPALFDDRGTDLLLSDAKPTHLSYCFRCGRAGTVGGTWVAHLAYFGTRTGCLVQLRALERFLELSPGVRIVGSSETNLDGDANERAARRAWRRNATALVKIIVPAASTGFICQALANWSAVRQRLHIDALPLHGCIFTGADLSAADAIALDQSLSNLLEPLGGLRVWHARPAGAHAIDPCGPAQPDRFMLMKLKKTMDPTNLFNPGRFLR